MIIGIAGTLAAGKGTVVTLLREAHGFAHYSASGLLKELLEAKGIAPNRDSYSELASRIRAHDPAGLAKLLHERVRADGVEDAIIEALHDLGEAEYIKQIGGVVLAVDAPIEVRYERTKARGSEKDKVTFADFQAYIAREEAGVGEGAHNIRAVVDQADYVIQNDGSLDELRSQVQAFLARYQPTATA